MNLDDINSAENKSRIAIVIVGYNRLKSIRRLLKSVKSAYYPIKDIPLVISIDCSGNEELYDYVKNFEWPYGDKYLNIQTERLGLIRHIRQCGNLTNYFKAVIILEDDLYVSPYFYGYCQQTVEKYGENNQIAEIALYRNDNNGYIGLPFSPIRNEYDAFMWQEICSWGEVWTQQMWTKFVDWMDNEFTEQMILEADMPQRIKGWNKAWSKYFKTYILNTNRYAIYPYISLTTNFNDAGEHGHGGEDVQVSMMLGNKKYNLGETANLATYDIFFNNEAIYEWLKIDKSNLCIDLYGMNRELKGRRYLLSPLRLPYNKIKSFGLYFRPIEINILHKIEGDELFLYDTYSQSHKKGKSYSHDYLRYFFKDFAKRKIWRYSIMSLKKTIKDRIKYKRR